MDLVNIYQLINLIGLNSIYLIRFEAWLIF